MLEVVTSYSWPNDGIPFAGLTVRVDDLAVRLELAIHKWDADGLGPASGFGFRTASGRVFLLEELELAVKYHRASGPSVYVDAADLAMLGTKVLVDDVVSALGVPQSSVMIFADAAAEQRAAELVARVAAARGK
jgi:hypothetical protein